ncbi:KATNB1-like protein 1 [Salarias fasciatus]|uniref:KATNB1-like protein 1 n=1 Tax=Salarias fasciatus TaxID=181472 RepID=A0A672H5V6_SALFA|nr:KATNB1-like protein 1 [Salarias fasciatus]
MDSNRESSNHENDTHNDATQFRVTYAQGRNWKGGGHDKNEEFNKKRCPRNPGRVKRVVSCKRKTHHLTAARRKQLSSGRTGDAANKENEMQDTEQDRLHMDPWDFPLSFSDDQKSCTTDPGQINVCTLTELSKDHEMMTRVLFGRNLRLRVAFTLWQRNVGELLTYFLRIQDTGVFVDFLPLIIKSIEEQSPSMTIGCCVDFFPLVTKVLKNPYEEHLMVGLKWVSSVLRNWSRELRASGFGGAADPLLDQNYRVFNQQLLKLWYEEPFLKSLPGAAGDLAMVIDSFLSQLT